MHPILVLSSAAVLVALAGCHAPTGGDEGFRLTGWFADHNETIAADFKATVSPYSDNVLLMESFPPGFQILDLDPDACAELREKLIAKEYLAEVGACEREPVADVNDNDTTSSDRS